MPKPSQTEKLANKVDDVFRFIDGSKFEIIERLFLNTSEGYKSEWYNRDVFGFWCHLDFGNRNAVVEMAIEHYS